MALDETDKLIAKSIEITQRSLDSLRRLNECAAPMNDGGIEPPSGHAKAKERFLAKQEQIKAALILYFNYTTVH